MCVCVSVCLSVCQSVCIDADGDMRAYLNRSTDRSMDS